MEHQKISCYTYDYEHLRTYVAFNYWHIRVNYTAIQIYNTYYNICDSNIITYAAYKSLHIINNQEYKITVQY